MVCGLFLTFINLIFLDLFTFNPRWKWYVISVLFCHGYGSHVRAIWHRLQPSDREVATVPPVPEPTQAGKIYVSSILCLDSAVSPHFHVVRLLEADEDDGFTEEILFEGFEIYSSETGCWVFHPHNSGWSPQKHRSRRTYFSGFLHFITRDERAVP
jgi:hypothetical protein